MRERRKEKEKQGQRKRKSKQRDREKAKRTENETLASPPLDEAAGYCSHHIMPHLQRRVAPEHATNRHYL